MVHIVLIIAALTFPPQTVDFIIVKEYDQWGEDINTTFLEYQGEDVNWIGSHTITIRERGTVETDTFHVNRLPYFDGVQFAIDATEWVEGGWFTYTIYLN